MRLYIKVGNHDYRKVQKWIKDNLVNSIPPCSDPERSKLSLSSGGKFTHIRFDVFEAEGSTENYFELDHYMTELMRDFSRKFLDVCKGSQCWYEYLRNPSCLRKSPKKYNKSEGPKYILHKHKVKVVDIK